MQNRKESQQNEHQQSELNKVMVISRSRSFQGQGCFKVMVLSSSRLFQGQGHFKVIHMSHTSHISPLSHCISTYFETSGEERRKKNNLPLLDLLASPQVKILKQSLPSWLTLWHTPSHKVFQVLSKESSQCYITRPECTLQILAPFSYDTSRGWHTDILHY